MKKQDLVKFVYYSTKWGAWLDITATQAAELLGALMEKKKKLAIIHRDPTLKNNITKIYHQNKVIEWLRGLDVEFDYSSGCEFMTKDRVDFLDKSPDGLGLICPFN